MRSNLALLVDGIPLGGKSANSRHGGVEVICVTMVSPYTHRLHSRLLAWCTLKEGKGGDATAHGVLSALAEKPLGLTAKELRKCLSLIGGDGALVRGGHERVSPCTQAAEKMWKLVYGAAAAHVAHPDDELLIGLFPRLAPREVREAPGGTFRRD